MKREDRLRAIAILSDGEDDTANPSDDFFRAVEAFESQPPAKVDDEPR